NRQVGFSSGINLLQRDRHADFEVLPAQGMARTLLSFSALRGGEGGKQIGQVYIREVGRFFMEVPLPLLRRNEVLALRMAAQRVVGRSLFGIFERGIGLG